VPSLIFTPEAEYVEKGNRAYGRWSHCKSETNQGYTGKAHWRSRSAEFENGDRMRIPAEDGRAKELNDIMSSELRRVGSKTNPIAKWSNGNATGRKLSCVGARQRGWRVPPEKDNPG